MWKINYIYQVHQKKLIALRWWCKRKDEDADMQGATLMGFFLMNAAWLLR